MHDQTFELSGGDSQRNSKVDPDARLNTWNDTFSCDSIRKSLMNQLGMVNEFVVQFGAELVGVVVSWSAALRPATVENNVPKGAGLVLPSSRIVWEIRRPNILKKDFRLSR